MTASRYAWLLVALLWVVALLNYLDRQVIFSVFPLLSRDLELSPAQLGLLSTAFLWIYGLLSPPAGYVADRFGRARVILVSLLLWSLITWATGHARDFPQLLIARALMGVSEAFYIPAALALIAATHSERTRSLATGVHQTGIYVGLVLGGAGGGWMGERYGWRAAFTILGVVGVCYAVLLTAALRPVMAPGPPTPACKPDFGKSLVRLLRLPGFPALTAVFGALSVANWLVYTWLPFYLYERFHMSLTLAGFSATFYIQAASLAGSLGGGWLGDRWSRKSSRGRVWTQALGLGVAGPFLFTLANTSSLLVLILSLVCFGLGRGFYDANAMPVLCQIARDELRATGYGVYNLAGCVLGGLAGALAGILKGRLGLGGAFQLAAALVLISAIGLVRATGALESSRPAQTTRE